MIILIGSEKGGGGKTTLATNLAVMRAVDGFDVLLLDTDKQESASNWATVRDEDEQLPRVACLAKRGKGILNEIKDLSTRYHDVVVDAGGHDSTELRSALLVADRIYIPCLPSQYDLWALDTMNELIGNAKPLNPNLEAFILFNKINSNPRRSDLNEALTVINDFEHLTYSGLIIRDRISFVKTASEGKGVSEYNDQKAIEELKQLYTHAFTN